MVSAAALEEGIISPSERIMCRRVPRLLGESFHCSHPPATQPFDLAEALANSCNYFFSELSTRLSASALAHWYGCLVSALPGEEAAPGEVLIPDKPRGKALAALGEQGVTATPGASVAGIFSHRHARPGFPPDHAGQRKAPSLDRVVPLQEKHLCGFGGGIARLRGERFLPCRRRPRRECRGKNRNQLRRWTEAT